MPSRLAALVICLVLALSGCSGQPDQQASDQGIDSTSASGQASEGSATEPGSVAGGSTDGGDTATSPSGSDPTAGSKGGSTAGSNSGGSTAGSNSGGSTGGSNTGGSNTGGSKNDGGGKPAQTPSDSGRPTANPPDEIGVNPPGPPGKTFPTGLGEIVTPWFVELAGQRCTQLIRDTTAALSSDSFGTEAKIAAHLYRAGGYACKGKLDSAESDLSQVDLSPEASNWFDCTHQPALLKEWVETYIAARRGDDAARAKLRNFPAPVRGPDCGDPDAGEEGSPAGETTSAGGTQSTATTGPGSTATTTRPGSAATTTGSDVSPSGATTSSASVVTSDSTTPSEGAGGSSP